MFISIEIGNSLILNRNHPNIWMIFLEVFLMKFKRGILFYHDSAGQGDVNDIIGEVTKNLSRMVDELLIFRSSEKGNIYEYIQDRGNTNDLDILMILGGDGTVHELINGVIDASLNIPIAILPGGTFNDFTKNLNLNPNPVVSSEQLLTAELNEYDVIQVNDRYALNFVGFGLIVENAQNIDQEAKSRIGKFSYLFSTIKTITNPTFFDYQITSNQNIYEGKSSMIVVSNGEFVGGNRIPLTELSPQDGKLDVFIFKESGLKLFGELMKEKSVTNWNEISRNIEHISTTELKIETSKAMDVDLDGEIDITTPLNIKIVPKRLNILTAQQ